VLFPGNRFEGYVVDGALGHGGSATVYRAHDAAGPDHVVALNANGRVIEQVGAFEGIGNDGAAKGLIFPASIVISGGFVYVTNAALALTTNIGDEPEEDVTTFTVSRFRLPN